MIHGVTKLSELNIRLTERDLQIIDFLFKVNFATLEQVAKYLKTDKEQSLYIRLNQLSKKEYVAGEKIFYSEPQVYAPGKKAKEVVNTDLSIPKVIPNLYQHTLKVVDLFLLLKNDPGISDIITEPELIRQKLSDIKPGESRPKGESFYNIPDLVMVKNERRIAYEVELSKKARKRVQQKIDFYSKSREYYQVFYLCGSEGVKNLIADEVQKMRLSHIEIVMYDEFLGGSQ